MRRSLREREMTPTSSKSISVSAITKTTAATTIISIPSSDSMTIINTKIENATEGLSSNCFNRLSNMVLPASRGKENVLTICDYISSIR
jgi:hypothetical protein